MLAIFKDLSHNAEITGQKNVRRQIGCPHLGCRTDLFFAEWVDDNIFQRKASLLTHAAQHVSEAQAGSGGGQAGGPVRQVDAAVLICCQRTRTQGFWIRDGHIAASVLTKTRALH